MCCSLLKALVDYLLIAPFHGRCHQRRRRDILSMNLEHLPDEACGSPVCHDDSSTWAADTFELRGYQVGTWSEHCADQADHQIEGAVLIGEHFGVAFVEMSIQIFCLRPEACLFDLI